VGRLRGSVVALLVVASIATACAGSGRGPLVHAATGTSHRPTGTTRPSNGLGVDTARLCAALRSYAAIDTSAFDSSPSTSTSATQGQLSPTQLARLRHEVVPRLSAIVSATPGDLRVVWFGAEILIGALSAGPGARAGLEQDLVGLMFGAGPDRATYDALVAIIGRCGLTGLQIARVRDLLGDRPETPAQQCRGDDTDFPDVSFPGSDRLLSDGQVRALPSFAALCPGSKSDAVSRERPPSGTCAFAEDLGNLTTAQFGLGLDQLVEVLGRSTPAKVADYVQRLRVGISSGCLAETPAGSSVDRDAVSDVQALHVDGANEAFTAQVSVSTHLGAMPTISVTIPETVVVVAHGAVLLSLLRVGGPPPSTSDLSALVTMATAQAGW